MKALLLERDATGKAVYVMFLCLGVATLLPYNSFIASPEYATKYYRFAAQDPHGTTEMPALWRDMETYIVIASSIPNILMQAFVVSPRGQRLPIHGRLLTALTVLCVTVVVVAVLPVFKPSERVAAAVFLSGVSIVGGGTAVLSASCFGLAAILGDRFVHAAVLGIGVSGAVTSGVRVLIKAAVHNQDFEGDQRQAYAFFSVAAVWLAGCIGMTAAMPRIAFLAKRVPEFGGDVEYDAKQRALLNSRQEEEQGATDQLVDVAEEENARLVEDAPDLGKPSRILRCIWPLMLANSLVYTVTLTLFPQLCSEADDSSFYPVVVIFLYNACDAGGRFITRFNAMRLPPRALLPLSICRVAFVPFMILTVKPDLIPGYVAPSIAMALVGLTNGVISSLAMMYAPASLLLADSERATAGSAMSFSVLGGCFAGSLVALGLNALLAKE